MSAQPKIDQREATLRGIADYAARARLQLRRRPAAQIADDVLRHIEQAALEALDELPAQLAPALMIAPAAGGATAGRRRRALAPITAARCAQILDDPPRLMERMAIVDVLSLVPDIGPVGARALLRRHRIAQQTWLGARSWARLADDVLRGGVLG